MWLWSVGIGRLLYTAPHMCIRGGRGRHSFVFSRSTGQLSWLGFQTFCSVPFLYELRQILDWSCTPTTLNLFDWLKLEVRADSLAAQLLHKACKPLL